MQGFIIMILSGCAVHWKKLRDGGNTVVLVEHHRKMIEMADHIVEMGPEPGMAGGRVLFEGSYKELFKE